MTTAIDHRKNLTVVGVDGSVSARNAVRWAATDVVGRDTTLLLVYATYPTGDICSEVAALRIPDRQLCTSILLSVYGPSSKRRRPIRRCTFPQSPLSACTAVVARTLRSALASRHRLAPTFRSSGTRTSPVGGG